MGRMTKLKKGDLLRLVRDGREAEAVEIKDRNGETVIVARQSQNDYLVYTEDQWERVK